MSEVKNWYNSYVIKQAEVGINIRHYTLINRILSDGLKSDSKILEIGCGIGTLTQLIAQCCNRGSIVATDISDESIQHAKINLNRFKNITFLVTDMIDFVYDDKFDFIILPDVLEHIPVQQHDNLFSSLKRLIKSTGKLIIHIPHPISLEYVRINFPEKLQVIDQSLYSDHIGSILYNNQFLLVTYEAYSLISETPDYVYIKAVPKYEPTLELISPNKIRYRKTLEKIKFFFRRIF